MAQQTYATGKTLYHCIPSNWYITLAVSDTTARVTIFKWNSQTYVGAVSTKPFKFTVGSARNWQDNLTPSTDSSETTVDGMTYYAAISTVGVSSSTVVDVPMNDAGYASTNASTLLFSYTYGNAAVGPAEPIQVDIPVLFKKYSKTYEAKQTITVNPPSN